MSNEPVYAQAVEAYWQAGWRGILPIPARRKKLDMRGYTGHDGIYPSWPDVMQWAEHRPGDNLALRLPPGFIGIDVDAYEGKNGAATFATAVREWGPLPKTWRSTSRHDDDLSGIRLFRIPVGIRLRDRIRFGDEPGDIEICQVHHRYIVCWPSIHPDTHAVYEWYRDDHTKTGLDVLPRVAGPNLDIPWLPEPWLNALRVDATEVTVQADVEGMLAAMPPGSMSVPVERLLDKSIQDLRTRGSRHDNTRDNVLRLLRLAESGEPGVRHALDRLKRAWVVAVSDDRDAMTAESEFDRMVTGQHGHNLIASTPSNLSDIFGPEGASRPKTHDKAADDDLDYDNSEPAYSDVDAALGRGKSVTNSEPARIEPMPEVNEDGEEIYRLLSVDELAQIKPNDPLIDGLLYTDTIAQLSGHPGTYKTFVALGMACAVASESVDRWCGFPVKAHGPVVYVAAEGVSGLRVRVLGWCEANGVDPSELNGRLWLMDHAVQLGSKSEVRRLARTLQTYQACMVVLDTRARCTVSLEENSATEQGEAIAAAEYLRVAMNCTVLLLHHSSRVGTAGRGSSAWDGAVWSDLRIQADGLFLTIHCEKHKDVDSGCDHEFQMERVTISPELMHTDDPFARNTLVVQPGYVSAADLPANQVLNLFHFATALSPHKAYELGSPDVSERTVYRAIERLVERGLLRNVGTEKRPMYLRVENTD